MGNLYLLPFKQGWENGAFWLLRGVILDIFFGGGGEGEVGYGCCFIFHDSVQDCSSMGSSYNLMIFWLKISMPGAADEISQNNR